jgi:hypothetical protein
MRFSWFEKPGNVKIHCILKLNPPFFILKFFLISEGKLFQAVNIYCLNYLNCSLKIIQFWTKNFKFWIYISTLSLRNTCVVSLRLSTSVRSEGRMDLQARAAFIWTDSKVAKRTGVALAPRDGGNRRHNSSLWWVTSYANRASLPKRCIAAAAYYVYFDMTTRPA